MSRRMTRLRIATTQLSADPKECTTIQYGRHPSNDISRILRRWARTTSSSRVLHPVVRARPWEPILPSAAVLVGRRTHPKLCPERKVDIRIFCSARGRPRWVTGRPGEKVSGPTSQKAGCIGIWERRRGSGPMSGGVLVRFLALIAIKTLPCPRSDQVVASTGGGGDMGEGVHQPHIPSQPDNPPIPPNPPNPRPGPFEKK